jgi:cell division septation protein DedD
VLAGRVTHTSLQDNSFNHAATNAALRCHKDSFGDIQAPYMSEIQTYRQRVIPFFAETFPDPSHMAALWICYAQTRGDERSETAPSKRQWKQRGTESAGQWGRNMAGTLIRKLVLGSVAALALSGCQDVTNPFTSKQDGAGEAGTSPSATSVRLVDRDVEAPDVFQVTDDALWDGRPSLGGVWVASPDAVDPERVILRNPGNGKFVIAALFRRERLNPGPPLQISSDAAAALGILAGQPAKLNVTALRREEVAIEAPDATKPILDANESVQTTTLDPIASASAALDKVAAQPTITPPIATAPAASKPAASKPAASKPAANGARNLIQIGLFSVEANAKRAAETLKKAGITANILNETSQGKTFWRVTAGPADAAGRSALLEKVKSLGFSDAYFVSR